MKLLSTTALTAALMTGRRSITHKSRSRLGLARWRDGAGGGAGVGLAAGALSRRCHRRVILRLRLWLPGLRLWLFWHRLWLPGLRLPAMGPVTPRPMAMVMAPATATVTRLTAMVMAPARAIRLTAVTGTPITPLSDAISMPPPTVFDVIGIGTNKPPGDTRPFSCGQVAMSALGQKPPRQLPTGASGLGQKPTSHRRFDDFDSRRQSISARAPELLSEGLCGSYVVP